MNKYDEIESNVVQVIEEARIQVKTIIQSSITKGVSKDIVKVQAIAIANALKNSILEFGKEYEKLANTSRLALINNFSEWYQNVIKELGKSVKTNPAIKSVYDAIQAKVFDPELNKLKTKSFVLGGDLMEEISDWTDKYKQTDAEFGHDQMIIEDYSKKVRAVITELSNKSLITYRKQDKSKPIALSIRNLAEMTVRYNEHQDEIAELKASNQRLVLVSQHSDASKRCSKWQGKVYSLDGTKGVTTDKNRRRFVPLENATKDHQLFGYNCRHRLIKYMPDMDLPKRVSWNKEASERKRKDDMRMREYERQIRKAKEKQVLVFTKAEKKFYRDKSQTLFSEYENFAKKKGRVVNTWRCSITRNERAYNDLVRLTSGGNDGNSGKYAIYKCKSDYDFSKHLARGKYGNEFSLLNRWDGVNHVEKSHPDFVKKYPNYLQLIENAIKKPEKIQADKNDEFTLNIINKLDSNHVLFISVLMQKGENRIKSCRMMNESKIKKKKQ